MSKLAEMMQPEWEQRTDAALEWIQRSFAANGGLGSSHSWHPVFGWSKAYPETSGYLIETLVTYAELKQNPLLQRMAMDCAVWLDSIQFDTGAFPGLLADNQTPSVFNTSQILFASAYLKGADRAQEWLLSVLETDGAWRTAAFVPGFVPSYYTRAVWAVLQSNDLVQNTDIEALMRKSLHFYAARFLPNGSIQDWGFEAGKPAFTHTIAYTLEGFWESGNRLGERSILAKTLHTLETLLDIRAKSGHRTAGRYDLSWEGDYSFICITGNCQLSTLCHKVWLQTGDPKFKMAAYSLLEEILPFQKTGSNKNKSGAFPASAPIWGAYLPFRYPNWGLKFFFDAMIGFRAIV